ncbi:MAG: helix-turn-helix domain-containing protein [Bacilli bacterium]|nr:helix-turn-helix domain-containing protein [Bacilli bacterium]
MDIKTQFGMRVRYLRTLKGYSQEELALESGINKNYISDLERGKRNPTLVIMEKLAIAFDIPLSELTKGLATFR